MIKITRLQFFDEYNQAATGDYLRGAIGDRLQASIEFEVSDQSPATPVKRCLTQKNTLRRTDSRDWSDTTFRPGDRLRIGFADSAGDTGPYTLREFAGPYAIFEEDIPDGELGYDAFEALLVLDVEAGAIELRYNLVPNSDGSRQFNALTDSTEQRWTGTPAGPSVPVAMQPNESSKAWQNGAAEVMFLHERGRRKTFLLTHTFLLVPFYLEDQRGGAGGLSTPAYFANSECLKYVFSLRVRSAADDPNFRHSSEEARSNGAPYQKLGNTGWWNETLNGGEPYFALAEQTRYRIASTNESVPGLSADADTQVIVKIATSTRLPPPPPLKLFESRLVLHVIELPTAAEYTRRTGTLPDNYRYDRLLMNLEGTTAASGANGDYERAFTGGVLVTPSSNRVMQLLFTVRRDYVRPGAAYALWITLDKVDWAGKGMLRTAVLLDTPSAHARERATAWRPKHPYCVQEVPPDGGDPGGGGNEPPTDPGLYPVQILGLLPMDGRDYDARVGCYSPLVLAEAGTIDPERNDSSYFLFEIRPSGGYLWELQKRNRQGTLILTTQINTPQVGHTWFPGDWAAHPNYTGKEIHWRNVLLLHGEGSYRIGFHSGGVKRYSPWFELETYSAARADQTVKISILTSGRMGNLSKQPRTFDLSGMEWGDSLRIRGFFGRPKSRYEDKIIKYENGETELVQSEMIETFQLTTGLLPQYVIDRLKTYAMLSERITVSDFNLNNSDPFLKGRQVRRSGGVEPQYFVNNHRVRAVFELEDALQNYRKEFC